MGDETVNTERFMYVGNWGFAPAPKGISVFRYRDADGSMKLLRSIRQDIAAGQMCLDEKRGILYASDECGEREGEIGGGGYLYAFRIDRKTGDLSLINRQDSLSPEPSYVTMTASGKYIVICHCADPFHVTKIVKREDGTYGNEVLFDDTALVLFPVLEDGALGGPCDVVITKGNNGLGPRSQRNVDPVSGHIQLVEVISRLHAVVASPDGKVFVALDKGMDKLYTFRIDEKEGKIIMLKEYQVDEIASFPRYGTFHPTKPVFYADNENLAQVNVYQYNEEGELQPVQKIPVLSKDVGLIDGKPAGCQDIVIHPSGKTLYVSISGMNQISVVSLDEEGKGTLVQEISCEGNFPRCIRIAPDERFILAGNMVSGDIAVYEICGDGTLKYTGKKFEAVSPSAIRFMDENC